MAAAGLMGEGTQTEVISNQSKTNSERESSGRVTDDLHPTTRPDSRYVEWWFNK